VKINTLSMIAEDYSDYAKHARTIYQIIRNHLLQTSTENMLPLVYVLDSILKNAKGSYISLVEKDAVTWLPAVYKRLSDLQRGKLEKVYKTWNEFKIFSPEAYKAMGACFETKAVDKTGGITTQVAGIPRMVSQQSDLWC
jgi:pre-mRNA cleavage complex 2 protein Pcf11